MAIEVKVKSEEETKPEEEAVKPAEEQEPTEPEGKTEEGQKVLTPEEERARKLELENAALKARLEERSKMTQEQPKPAQSPEQEQYQKTKQIVTADAQSLDDDAFQEKYKMTKADARAHMLEYELQAESTRNAEERAFLRAENTVAKRYGEKYSQYQSQIEDSLHDVSPAVKKDPAKLSAYMERQLKAFMADETKETPKPKPSRQEGEPVKRIVQSGFEKPGVVPDEPKSKGNDTDEIAESDRKLAGWFGLTSEKERKKLKASPYVETDYGHGVVFTEKGFEHRKPK